MSNLAETLRTRLSPEHLAPLQTASEVAARQNAGLYLVGGTVRDLLLGYASTDLDLSVVGDTEAVAGSLAAALEGEIVARSQFNTFKLSAGEIRLDLAMARRESYARPGALPAVQPGSIDDDLARRDFSINAMAISLGQDGWGECLDPFGGGRDLERRLIRVLHPRSFQDDATRILRAIRYAARLGFRIEEEPEALLRRDIGCVDSISGDRVRPELDRVLEEEKAPAILVSAQRLKILAAVHPALRLDESMLDSLKEVPDVEEDLPAVLLSLLTLRATAEERSELVTRLNMDARWRTLVEDTGVVAERLEALGNPLLRPSQMHSLLDGRAPAAIRAVALSSGDPGIERNLDSYLRKGLHEKTILRGGDLIAIGVPEGPTVGRLLKDLLAARLDGLVETREEEQTFVARRLQS